MDNNVSLDDKIMQKALQNLHFFPYHLFRRDMRVVLYGAGNIGRQYYWQVQQNSFVRLCGIVDKNWDKIQVDGMKVESPETIAKMQYDAILITMNRPEVAREAHRELVARGCKPERIYWDGETYYHDHYYWHLYFPLLDKIGQCKDYRQMIEKAGTVPTAEKGSFDGEVMPLGERTFMLDFLRRMELKQELLST